mgnify:CR=1 FL=1
MPWLAREPRDFHKGGAALAAVEQVLADSNARFFDCRLQL